MLRSWFRTTGPPVPPSVRSTNKSLGIAVPAVIKKAEQKRHKFETWLRYCRLCVDKF